MLISIIIPAFNRERLIKEALTSVVNQRWRPVEVVVVDDGSVDQTAAVAEAFGKKAAESGLEFHVLRSSNRGSTAARNAGIKIARGDACLFLDSDDILLPDGLSLLVKALRTDNTVDFSYGQVVIGDENLKRTAEVVGVEAVDLLEDPITYHWHTMGALYRRSLITACGGWDETVNGSDDWVLQSRVKLVARKARYVDAEVGIWRQHSDERLGATSFRESYTVDVTKACLAVHRQWSGAGKMKPRHHRRLFFRALRHCWELGTFGSKEERKMAFQRLKEIETGLYGFSWMATMFKAIPSMFDRFLYALVSQNR